MTITGNNYQLADRFLPVYHVMQGDTFVLRENGIDRVVTLPHGSTGWYYGHDSSSGIYRGLFHRMPELMESADSGTNNTYEFSLTHGTRPDDTLFARYLRIERTSGSFTWLFNFDHPEWTLDKRLLGEREDASGWYGGGSSDTWTSSLGTKLIWQPPVVASDKRRIPKKTSFAFSKGKSSSVWTSMAKWDVRKFEYRFVPAPHVFSMYSDNATRANEAGLEQYDDHNAFEYFWRQAPYGKPIVMYDKSYDWGMANDPSVYRPYEILKWVDVETLEDFEKVVEPVEDAGGELYNIKFEMAIWGGGNDVDHSLNIYDH